jgi:hypothetical protein
MRFRNITPKKASVLENILSKYKMRQLILIGTDIASIILAFMTSNWIIYSQYKLQHIDISAILIYNCYKHSNFIFR